MYHQYPHQPSVLPPPPTAPQVHHPPMHPPTAGQGGTSSNTSSAAPKKPAYIKVNPPIATLHKKHPPVHLTAASAAAAATKLTHHPATANPEPAKADNPTASENWPPSLKLYVERSFKIAPFRQRSKLQQVLRTVITDAQRKGELWTRAWDKLPLPDLTQSADDASSIVLAAALAWRQKGARDYGYDEDKKAGGPQHQGPPQISASALAMVSHHGSTKNTISSRHVTVDSTLMSTFNSKRKDELPRYTFSDSEDSLIDVDFNKKKKKRKKKADENSIDSSEIDNNTAKKRKKKEKSITDRLRGREIDDDDEDATTNTYTPSIQYQDYTRKKSVSQGGPLSNDEELRRLQRAGRFKDGKADGAAPGSLEKRALVQAARKARVKSALLKADQQQGTSKYSRRHRLAMFNKENAEASLDGVSIAVGLPGGGSINWDVFAIKGTCQELEKSYFRLTSAPDPSTVRPPPVLEKALQRLVDSLAEGRVNYFYAQDQFKGLRQDCVIQALKGTLTRRVYEAHARAALEYGDVAEYNQCQGQLRVLYGDSSSHAGPREQPSDSESEFLAYRLLYQSVHLRHGEALPLLHTLKHIAMMYPTSTTLVGQYSKNDPVAVGVGIPSSPTDKKKKKNSSKSSTSKTIPTLASMPCEVTHALQVRKALAKEDHVEFFRLYQTAPKLGRALMDLAVPRLRFAALNTYVKAFKPTLPVDFIARSLGFLVAVDAKQEAMGNDDSHNDDNDDDEKKIVYSTIENTKHPLPGCSHSVFKGEYASHGDELQGMEECIDWLVSCSAVIDTKDMILDCKASMGRLKVPEEKDAVAHGDANLDIGDFLKSFA